MPKKKRLVFPKSTLVSRFPIQVKVNSDRRFPPSVQMLYRCTYVEKVNGVLRTYDRIEYGQQLRTAPNTRDLNGTKAEKEKSRKALRPELFAVLNALALLMDDVGKQCMRYDEEMGLEIGNNLDLKKKAKKK